MIAPQTVLSTPVKSKGLARLPGKLPVNDLPNRGPSLDLDAISQRILEGLLTDVKYTDDAIFRDQFALTGTLRTIYGGGRARATWLHLAKQRRVSKLALVPQSSQLMIMGADIAWIEARFTFETSAGLPAMCSGFLNIVPHPTEPDQWALWGLQTLLEEFIGHEMQDLRKVYPDTKGINGVNGINGSTTNGSNAPRMVDTIIVGAGQAGLCTAAYAKAAGLSYCLVEKNEEVGHNWSRRYESLYLHTPHRFNDLAFGPTFNNEEYSEWLTSKELERGYKTFVKRFHIDVWCSSVIQSCTYSEVDELWTMSVKVKGELRTVQGRDLCLCTGPGGTVPLRPTLPGQESFKGSVMHSVDWKSAEPFKGQRGVVIGTANTGHDVAENMADSGMHTTMVQRNPTYVIPRDFMTALLNMVWNPNRPQELSDRAFWSPPTAVARLQCYAFFDPMYAKDMSLFDKLTAAGFQNDPNGDFIDHLLVRFGGHFMNHGASEKIAEGVIKVKSGSAITGFTETGLQFADGSVIPADVVVFATGFEKDTKLSAGKIIGPLAEQLDDFFGVDEEGEVKGAFKPCGVPHLLMAGGGCAHARYFPRLMVLQMLANKLGQPLPVFQGFIEPSQV